jgi:RimJ/RimL family protein N-acetyltransferase
LRTDYRRASRALLDADLHPANRGRAAHHLHPARNPVTLRRMRDWKPCDAPNLPTTRGRFVQIDPLDAERDADELFGALGGADNDDLWRFIPFGPLESADALVTLLSLMIENQDWQTHLFRSAETGEMLGMSSYMRIRPEAGSAEVGCVMFSKTLQRTPAATEAMFTMARHLFDDLGYRRYEWKCDNENAASKRAAERLGFSPEGVFRQDMVVKGRNRDTAWFSMLDREWPLLRRAFEQWLAPANFDAAGKQHESLSNIRDKLRASETS